MEALLELVVFAAKAGMMCLAVALIVGLIAKSAKDKITHTGKIKVLKLSERLAQFHKSVDESLLSPTDFDTKWKGVKPASKPKKLFVLDFNGGIEADEVKCLREEITTIITTGCNADEVLIRLQSGGGTVDGYGLVASQIDRLKKAGLKVTVSVDRVAASGGYMGAVVADKIIAAPFSYIGSIGVIGQVPNIHKLLKEKGIEIEQHTAGQYKRTLTTVGETTDEGREKFKADLQRMHEHFKDHILKYRPDIEIEKVATGEVWNGSDALELGLIDDIKVSDDFIGEMWNEFEVLELKYEPPRTPNSFIASLSEQAFFKPVGEMIKAKILA